MDLLADIEALQAELELMETAPTKEDKAALAKEEAVAAEAAAKARGSRDKSEPVATPDSPKEESKPKSKPKPKPKAVSVTGQAAPAVKLEALPKKVKEKALNAIKALETGAPVSKYTALALDMIREGGCKRSELVAMYVEAGLGKSTANAQASQMQSLLPALGAAKLIDGELKPVASSPFLALGCEKG